MRLSTSHIAGSLNISISTVERTLTFSGTGTTYNQPYPTENTFIKILTEPVKLFIFNLVLQKPGILLRENVQEVSATLGTTVTGSAICKVLKKDGFTYQKLRT